MRLMSLVSSFLPLSQPGSLDLCHAFRCLLADPVCRSLRLARVPRHPSRSTPPTPLNAHSDLPLHFLLDPRGGQPIPPSISTQPRCLLPFFHPCWRLLQPSRPQLQPLLLRQPLPANRRPTQPPFNPFGRNLRPFSKSQSIHSQPPLPVQNFSRGQPALVRPAFNELNQEGSARNFFLCRSVFRR